MPERFELSPTRLNWFDVKIMVRTLGAILTRAGG